VRQLPTGRSGRALALAIAALGVVVFYFLAVSPVLDFYNTQEELVRQRMATAERYKTLARQLPDLRIADKKWRDQFGGELLLDGQSDADASAAIQGAMKQAVEDAGAKLTSAEILPEKTDGNFRRVGVRVAFSGDLKLVTTVMRSLETAHPVLFAGDFDLHSGTEGDSSEDSGAGSEGLSVTLDVYGFRAG
jgi:Type II secretion system (T2SS), protein M subtype b